MSAARPRSRLGLLTVATSVALFATACGSDGEVDADQEPPDETEVADEKDPEPTLGDPGILAVDCADNALVATLFSDEDGNELVSRSFEGQGLTGEEVPDFAGGRPMENPSVSLPVCPVEAELQGMNNTQQVLLPDAELLLVTATEDVGGTEVETVGVLDAEGNLSALTEDQEVSDFETPAEFTTPRYDPADDRILYLEPDPEDHQAGIFHEFALDTGEATEAFACEDCRSLWVDQASGLLSVRESPLEELANVILSPDGSVAAGVRDNAYWSVDAPSVISVVNDATEDGPVDDALALDTDAALLVGNPEADGEPALFVSETEMVLSDNELSVIEVGESDLAAIEEDELSIAGTPIPIAYTLVPDGPRTNGSPVLAPDGDEVAFLSQTDAGDASWYRVPTDGSEDPTEIGPVDSAEDETADYVPLSWN
ncbi:hypothetical protein J4H86_22150 [Spiractinospora alimapuensis]|uniref:hypothetical protein n=1 Tax=Spiractinospora alimapuensis TaxID=2820884 RepID=UPI001F338CDF|nr:hypothetical protein [Spiractinospora alimapuensis]QVQ51470.1 hypothetical protein J4H86_22150 [Spiractinospora alimapuensis]